MTSSLEACFSCHASIFVPRRLALPQVWLFWDQVWFGPSLHVPFLCLCGLFPLTLAALETLTCLFHCLPSCCSGQGGATKGHRGDSFAWEQPVLVLVCVHSRSSKAAASGLKSHLMQRECVSAETLLLGLQLSQELDLEHHIWCKSEANPINQAVVFDSHIWSSFFQRASSHKQPSVASAPPFLHSDLMKRTASPWMQREKHGEA